MDVVYSLNHTNIKNNMSRFHTTNVIKCVGDKVDSILLKLPYNLSWDLYNPTKTIILSGSSFED